MNRKNKARWADSFILENPDEFEEKYKEAVAALKAEGRAIRMEMTPECRARWLPLPAGKRFERIRRKACNAFKKDMIKAARSVKKQNRIAARLAKIYNRRNR